ncbi:MAG: hypothetical protein B6I36_06165 [Desulfobacteraceae bacterium 4572_35.1]|nr:MAG: hypothetical protein B6I36_06165 [Desulfobacteraceae bacterium 4572_35.1]
MIINNSTVQMNAQHQLIEQHGQSESLTAWGSNPQKTSTGTTSTETPTILIQEQKNPVILPSQAAVDINLNPNSATNRRTEAAIIDNEPLSPAEDFENSLLRRLVEMLTGKKINISTGQELAAKTDGETIATTSRESQTTTETGDGAGLIYTYQEYSYESEQFQFSTQAQVETADGRNIEIAIDLNMSREFYQQTTLEMRAGVALKDPLVLNFNGNSTELSNNKFSFDLDLDGQQDQISLLGKGSGFLAIDNNKDGVVNDGSELFGAKSGDGFRELAKYDIDGNNWIDEADNVFDNLRIWKRNDDGENKLLTLSQAGVGAIYLGNSSTPFSLNNQNNEQLGAISSSGFFLYEDGRAGTVQQVDFVV